VNITPVEVKHFQLTIELYVVAGWSKTWFKGLLCAVKKLSFFSFSKQAKIFCSFKKIMKN
jgi:hypothetical protein